MAACPFHVDTNPSLKLNRDFYYCFGCGASGDVIDFVGQLRGLSMLAAAKMLAADFSIAAGTGSAPKVQTRLSIRKEEERAYLELLEYRKNLKDRLKTSPFAEPDFQEAELCRELEKTECMLDLLAVGDSHERLSVVKQLQTDSNIASKECVHVQ